MKRIIIIGNYDEGVYKFRKELIENLIMHHYDVCVSTPYGEYIPLLEEIGCGYEKIEYNRAGKNIFQELKLLKNYFTLLKKNNFDVALLYTIKPTLYAGLVCRIRKIPYIVNITGLSPAITNSSLLKKICFLMYRRVLTYADMVFFQNKDNLELFQEENAVKGNYALIPGSGVNLKEHTYEPYVPDTIIKILYIGRITKVKGIDELLEAIQILKKGEGRFYFEFVGHCDEIYEDRIQELQEEGILIYHGVSRKIHDNIKNVHAVIMPSYGEGMSNVLLEASACGRPVLASNVTGCKEIVLDGKTGFLFPAHSVQGIVQVLKKFADLSDEERQKMGKCGHQYVKEHFSREIVVNAYMREINKICGGKEHESV